MATKDVLSIKQRDSIMEARAFQNIWEGSVRSGKTIASLLCWLGFVANPPETGELVMVGRTRDSLFRNVLSPLMDPAIFGDFARDISYTNGAPMATVLGRPVHVLGANDAQAEFKVRGLTGRGAYCDEITTLPQAFYDQLDARCNVPGSKIFGTTNPDNPSHWTRKKYLQRPREARLRSWHFTMDDNPGLTEEYKARQRASQTGLFYKRNILGLWVMAEGSIYEAWDEERHVVTELPAITRWIAVGIDVGTMNPFHAVLVGIGADGCLYVASEWRHDGRAAQHSMTDAEYSAAVRTWLAGLGVRPEWVIVDPSASSFIEQLHRDHVTVTMADNAVIDGIRTVASLLALDKLRVHASCKGLIEEMPSYVWDDKAAEAKGKDQPVKAHDHGLDALRYALRTTEALWRPYIPMTLATAA